MNRRARVAYVLTIVVMWLSASNAHGQLAPLPSGEPAIRSAQTFDAVGRTTVVIEADGPLPLPTPGTAENPPRLFFDFSDVTTRIRGMRTTPGAGRLVRQTRIAQYSVNPSVTRVVIDLTAQQEPYRIISDQRRAGRITIVVGPESTTARVVPPAPPPPKPVEPPPSPTPPPAFTPRPMPSAPAPSEPPKIPAPMPPSASPPPSVTTPMLPPSPTPPSGSTPPRAGATPAPAIAIPPPSAAPAPATDPGAAAAPSRRRPMYIPPPAAPKPPPREIERYRERLSGAIERLEAQQAIVVAIDAQTPVSVEAMQAALNEFTTLGRLLNGIKLSGPLSAAHDLLIASCTLGATASRLGIDALHDQNQDVRHNAASAAAGALMFFDRACAELGCTRPQ